MNRQTEKRFCCHLSCDLFGCEKKEKSDFVIRAGREVLVFCPLTCFVEQVLVKIGIENLPGMNWNLGNGSGELDLIKFEARNGTIKVGMELASFFGGAVRGYLFPVFRHPETNQGRRIWIGEYRKAFEPPLGAAPPTA